MGDRSLDELDHGIVNLLQEDGRMSHTELARRLGSNESTVRNRIARLLDDGRMRVVAVPGPQSVGRELFVYMRVTVQPAHATEVAERLAAFDVIRYVALSDEFDVMTECAFGDRQDVVRFVRDQVAPLPGVTRVSTQLMLKVFKYSFEWRLPDDYW